MANQYYKVRSFEKSDFKDRNDNYWCQAVFEGQGEPTVWVMKEETVLKIEVGKEYYGEIRDYTSAKGKVIPRFYKAQEPEQGNNQSFSADGNVKKEWQPREDHHEEIKAQWAIGQAAHILAEARDGDIHKADLAWVETTATQFYAMVDRVKGSAETREPSPSKEGVASMDPEELQARKDAERDAERLRNTVRDDSVYDTSDEPINLDDIPF